MREQSVMRLIDITREQAMATIERGELPDEVIGSDENVAAVLTQDWCPQWTAMERWIGGLNESESAPSITVDIYILLYNREDYFREFLRFKENVWKNRAIPYVRYYRRGRLISESNYVSRESFLEVFKSTP
jgi:hypothetical protein